jgi:putative Mn2+ efflux pump MntP
MRGAFEMNEVQIGAAVMLILWIAFLCILFGAIIYYNSRGNRRNKKDVLVYIILVLFDIVLFILIFILGLLGEAQGWWQI